MYNTYTNITVSTADVVRGDHYGRLTLAENDHDSDRETYPAVIQVDTDDGIAQLALTKDQLVAIRDTISTIIRNHTRASLYGPTD